MSTTKKPFLRSPKKTKKQSNRRGPLLLLSVALGLGASVTAAAVVRRKQQQQKQAEQNATLSPLELLAASQFMNLTTFRKNGVAVVTPVWFAEEQGTFYLATTQDTGKVKRIRRSGESTMTISTRSGEPIGEPIKSSARVLGSEDAQEIAIAERALARKYGPTRAIFYAAMGIVKLVRRNPGMERAYIAVVPVTA